MKELIIDRKTWLRGEGSVNSKLLRDDGKMCCIGFYCKQILDISKEVILNKAEINTYPHANNVCIAEDKMPNTLHSMATEYYLPNDKVGGRNKDREKIIRQNFKAAGIKVKFIN